ncbi:hypothetical protein [Alkalimarinus coralli]|uniref:hypothetical protein n=1 Tax=Alkalimarinus coralli TaxID=2935863 RepID=UPI00202B68D7|nr:hypothetical protein [Alkalimarinus coralli]
MTSLCKENPKKMPGIAPPACAMLSTKLLVQTKPGDLSVGGEMNGNVFAGGMLKNEAELKIEWAKPVSQSRQQSGRVVQPTLADFSELIKVSPSVSVAFGVGLGLDFNVGYSRGKFVAELSAQLVCGPGGAGGVAAELSVEQVVELIKFVRHALEASDFRFLEWLSEAAFDMISKITELYLNLDRTLESLVSMTELELSTYWKKVSLAQKTVKDECRRILSGTERVSYMTPIAKARVLNRVSNTYLFEAGSLLLDDELQAAACMRLLESIRSERELIEILRLMGGEESKGRSDILIKNFKKIFDYLLFQSKQKSKARIWLQNRGGTSAFLE